MLEKIKSFKTLSISYNLVLDMITLYTSPLYLSVLPERIGQVIKERRVQLGLTQKQLALRCHFSHNIISKMERGKHNFKVTDLERLGFGLETSFKYFFAVL